MIIYKLCIDPEDGKYLAVSTTDPKVYATSHTSADEAVGRLIATHGGNVEAVIDLDEVVTT